MRSGAIIFPLLINYADLTALVPSSKIFALRAEQSTDGPYIIYREISSIPLDTKGDSTDNSSDPRIKQRSILDISTIQISIFAETYLEVENISVQVRKALDREWGSVNPPYNNDVVLDSLVYESSVDDYDDSVNSRGTYVKHLDFKLRIGIIDIYNTWENNFSLAFDGVDDYLNAGNSSINSPNSSGANRGFSVSFWFKKFNTESQWIINKNQGFANGQYNYEYAFLTRFNDEGRFVLHLNNSLTDYLEFTTTAALPNNEWIHIAVNWDLQSNTNGFNMYINNVLKNTSNGGLTGSLNGAAGPVVSGNSNLYFARSGGTNYSNINVDEFSLWDKILTTADVNELYNNGVTGDPNRAPLASPYLMTYLRMGDGAVFPNIPNEAPSYATTATMINMDSTDIINNTPE